MKSDDYLKFKDYLLSLAEKIEESKRPAYTQEHEDVLHNFKSVAERVGITPEQAWGVYFLKHVDALMAAVKNSTTPQAEPLEGRFADAVNYLKLGFPLFFEDGLVKGISFNSDDEEKF